MSAEAPQLAPVASGSTPASTPARRPATTTLWVGAALAVVVTSAALVGLMAALGVEAAQWFDLDAERGGAAAVSALVLALAGATATLVWWSDRAAWAVLPVGLLLCWMAYDEVAFVHERLEAATGVDWLVLYLPAFACAGVGFLVVLRRYWALTTFRITWIVGAACWSVSQALEKLQWDGAVERPGYTGMMVSEEILEMVGSACFLLAMVVVITSVRTQRAGKAPAV